MPKIKDLSPDHSATILEIINDSATAYKGVIPADRWTEPYISAKMNSPVKQDGFLLGIAGIQKVSEGACTPPKQHFVKLFGLSIGGPLLAGCG
jgi:hypothetical protein